MYGVLRHKEAKNGGWRAYSCHQQNNSCKPVKYIPADQLEKKVWDKVKSWINDPDLFIKEVMHKDNNESKLTEQIEEFNKMLINIEKGRSNIIKAMAGGLLELDDNTAKTLKELKVRETNIREQSIILENTLLRQKVTEKQLEPLRDFHKTYFESDILTFEQRQAIVRKLVRQVVVTNGIDVDVYGRLE
jgi:site-specific DNA recombinase